MRNNIPDFKEDLFRLGLKAIILNDKKEVLLLRVEKTDRQDYTVKNEYWDFPGGQVDYSESLTDGLKREVLEEIGVKQIKIHQMINSTVTKFRNKAYSRDVGLIIFAYYCTIDQNQKFIISEEHTSFSWESSSKLKKLIGNKYDDIFIKHIQNFIKNVN